MEFVLQRMSLTLATALGHWNYFCRAFLLRGAAAPNERFVPIKKRRYSSELVFSGQFIRAVQRSKHNRLKAERPPIHWKGVLNMKDPFSLASYPLLLAELKPATIIELGSYNGGSALWLADMLEIQGVDGRVYSFDIDIDKIFAIKNGHPKVQFRKADTNDLSTLDREWLASLPHPWLVIEDAHQNIYNVLRFFGDMMVVGDYFVVEDTLWPQKYADFKKFATIHQDEFLVDTLYTDLFGYNTTWNPNGYLKKVTRSSASILAGRR